MEFFTLICHICSSSALWLCGPMWCYVRQNIIWICAFHCSHNFFSSFSTLTVGGPNVYWLPQLHHLLAACARCHNYHITKLRTVLLREASIYQNGWIFGKKYSKISFLLRIYLKYKVSVSPKNSQYDYPKMRGGGQRPFGTFPKIHPFW